MAHHHQRNGPAGTPWRDTAFAVRYGGVNRVGSLPARLSDVLDQAALDWERAVADHRVDVDPDLGGWIRSGGGRLTVCPTGAVMVGHLRWTRHARDRGWRLADACPERWGTWDRVRLEAVDSIAHSLWEDAVSAVYSVGAARLARMRWWRDLCGRLAGILGDGELRDPYGLWRLREPGQFRAVSSELRRVKL